MKTIAQQLGITEFPFEIKDKNGKKIYRENSKGYWEKREFDSNGKEIYFENSKGYWIKCEYDSKGNQVYYENSNGFWIKCEYDSKGNQVYYERIGGLIINNKPKEIVELTLDQIAEKMGIDVSQLRTKE